MDLSCRAPCRTAAQARPYGQFFGSGRADGTNEPMGRDSGRVRPDTIPHSHRLRHSARTSMDVLEPRAVVTSSREELGDRGDGTRIGATGSGWGDGGGWIRMGGESKIRVCGGGGEMDLWEAGLRRV
jgi:hypothetical protein